MKIEKTLLEFCIAKGIEATKERIEIQANFLRTQNYSESEIIKAIGDLFGETPFFPDASMILKKLRPCTQDVEIEAQAIVGRIMGAMKSFGTYQAKEVHVSLGDTAWYVVERFGGWDSICALTYAELGTARAQLRKIAESAVRMKTHGASLDYSSREARKLQDTRKMDFENLLTDAVGEGSMGKALSLVGERNV